MRNSGIIQVAVLALFLASAGARADGAALHNYAADGTPAWADNPEYMDCGLKCVYLESVEKISVRSRHTLETLNQMKEIKDTDTDAQAKMDSIIPGMCDWNGSVTGQKESVKDCQIRWFKVQLPTLYQDRLAIKYNTSYAGQLEDTKVPAINSGGSVTIDPTRPVEPGKTGLFVNAVDSDYTPKNQIVTTMEQYKDIRDRALVGSRNPRLTQITVLTQQIERTTDVSREEFVKTKDILKDPGDPTAGTYSIVQTNKDGTPQYDDVAYKNAVVSRGTLLGLTAAEKSRLEANLKNIGDLQRAQLTQQNATHEKIYTSVRSSILGAARTGLQKFNIIAPAAPKAPKAPAVLANDKGPRPAALSRAAVSPGGVSTDDVTKNAGNTGDDRDIVVPPATPAGSRPYFTVGYSDNVLGGDIQVIEQSLGNLEKP